MLLKCMFSAALFLLVLSSISCQPSYGRASKRNGAGSKRRGWIRVPKIPKQNVAGLINMGASAVQQVIPTKKGHRGFHRKGAAAEPVTIIAVLQILFNVGKFIYGKKQEQSHIAELRKINSYFAKLDKTIMLMRADLAQIKTQLGQIQVGQTWTQEIALYGHTVNRLLFLTEDLKTDLKLQADGTLGPAGIANAWADSVVTKGPGGMDQVLSTYNTMVLGRPHLFQTAPIIVVYMNTLNKQSPYFLAKVRKFVWFLYHIHVAGYFAWATALNIKGRYAEVPMVQRQGLNNLINHIRLMSIYITAWPTGTYGIPKSSLGCPIGAGVTWKSGIRKHDTNDFSPGNKWSLGIHFPPKFAKNNMEQHFCMKVGPGGEGPWPKGTYCIFKRGACPAGFYVGAVKWDDQNDRRIWTGKKRPNTNWWKGEMPEGVYNKDTVINYCCRSDAPYTTPMRLPVTEPFYLFRYETNCQKVQYATFKEEWFYWDNQNKKNRDYTVGAHPFENGGVKDHRLHYCYYTPNIPSF